MSNPADPSSLLSDFLALPPESAAGATPPVPPPAGTVAPLVEKSTPVAAPIKGEAPSEDRRLMGLTWMKDCSELLVDGPVFAPVTEGPVTSTATQLLNTPYRRDTGKTKLKPRVKGSGTSVRKGVREVVKPFSYEAHAQDAKTHSKAANGSNDVNDHHNAWKAHTLAANTAKTPKIRAYHLEQAANHDKCVQDLTKESVNEKIGQSLSMELGSSKAAGSTANVAGLGAKTKYKPAGYAGARSSAMQASDSAHKSNDRDSHLFARNAHAYASMMSDDADDKKFHHHYAIQHDKLAGGRVMTKEDGSAPYADLPNLICEWYDEHDAVDRMILEAELVNALQAGTKYFAALQERETPNSPRQTKLNRQSTLASNLAFNSSAGIKNRDDHEAHSRAHQLHTKAADLAAKTGNIELEKHHRGIAGAHANLAKSRQLGKEGGAAYEKWAASGKKTNRASDSTKKSLLFGGLMKVGSAIKSGARKAVDAVKKTISHDDAVKHLKSLKHTDGPVKLSFTKGNGEHREMNARFGVEHKLKGKGASYDREKAGHLTAFDEDKKGYRNIPTRNLKMVHVNGVPHEVNHGTKEGIMEADYSSLKQIAANKSYNANHAMAHSSGSDVERARKEAIDAHTQAATHAPDEDSKEFHQSMVDFHAKDTPSKAKRDLVPDEEEEQMRESHTVSAKTHQGYQLGKGFHPHAYDDEAEVEHEIGKGDWEHAHHPDEEETIHFNPATKKAHVSGETYSSTLDNVNSLKHAIKKTKTEEAVDEAAVSAARRAASARGGAMSAAYKPIGPILAEISPAAREAAKNRAAKQQQPPAKPTSEGISPATRGMAAAKADAAAAHQSFATHKENAEAASSQAMESNDSKDHWEAARHHAYAENAAENEDDRKYHGEQKEKHMKMSYAAKAEESDATAGDKTRESALASVLPNVLTALRQSSFARDGWAITNLTPTRQDHPLVEKML